MKFETEFNVGQKVWYVGKKWVVKNDAFECPVCRGTGYPLFAKNRKCDFSLHNGTYRCKDGMIKHYVYKCTPKLVEIADIFIRVDALRTECEYRITSTAHVFDEITDKDLFLTKEECQAECDRRNNDE